MVSNNKRADKKSLQKNNVEVEKRLDGSIHLRNKEEHSCFSPCYKTNQYSARVVRAIALSPDWQKNNIKKTKDSQYL